MNTNYLFFACQFWKCVLFFNTFWSLPPPLYGQLLKFNTPHTFRWFFACQIWKLVPPFQVLSWILSPHTSRYFSIACPFPSLSGPQLQFAPYSKSLLGGFHFTLYSYTSELHYITYICNNLYTILCWRQC